jgi:hypothetical protein
MVMKEANLLGFIATIFTITDMAVPGPLIRFLHSIALRGRRK